MSSLAEQYPSRAECANMFVETISIFRTRRVCVLHKSTSMLRCVCVCVCCLVCKSVVLGMQMRRGAQQPAKFGDPQTHMSVNCVMKLSKKCFTDYWMAFARCVKFVEVMCVFLPGKKIDFVFWVKTQNLIYNL